MMLKLFVILVFAAVVFGDNSSTSSLMTFSKPKSTTTAQTTTAASAPTTMPTSTLKPTPTATSTATAMPTSTLKPTPTATSTATAKLNSTAATTATPTTSTQASKTTTPYLTTSLKPTNTTTPPPATTITPPAAGNFSLKDKNGSYCILAQFDASFNIKYDFKVGNSSFKNSTTEYLDSMHQDDVNITGECGKKEAVAILVLSWPKKGPLYVFTMEFERLDAASPSSNMTPWMVHDITFNVVLKNNPKFNFSLGINKTSVLGMYNSSSGFGGHIVGNYFCDHNKRYPLSSDVNDFTITSAFKHMRLEPFVEKKGVLDFDKNDTKECYQDHPTTAAPQTTKPPDNNIVPIAVGCALAGLVLIVLIAYVIGRRKSHSGYEKV